MARMFSLEQALPPATISLEFLRDLETEMRHRAEKYPFAVFRFSIEDHIGIETFDSVADDGVSVHLKQCQSVHLEHHSEEDGFQISLDIGKLSGETRLRVQTPGTHARGDAQEIAARIHDLVVATNAGAPTEQQYRHFARAMALPSVKFTTATARSIRETIVRICAAYCEVDPGVIKVENEATLERGTTTHNITIKQLEDAGFPSDIKSFSMTCECIGGRRGAKVELEFSHKQHATLISVMGVGETAEEFARGAYREIARSLQRMRTHHGWLFVGQRFPVATIFSGIALVIVADIAWDSEVPDSGWFMVAALLVMLAPFLGYLVPYTQFDNFSTRRRVRVVNWILGGVATAALGGLISKVVGG